MKYLFLFLLTISSRAYSQEVRFKEIKLKPKAKFFNTKAATIIYPLVSTKNDVADKLINDQIKNEFFYPEDEKMGIKECLNERINDGLINLEYEATFKRKGILSLKIFSEGCGAYCSSEYYYFNFDLKTGKTLNIEDLIREDKLNSFRNMVFKDKVKQLEKYKKEEKDYLNQNEIDSSTYDFAIEQVDSNCIKDIEIINFSLSDQYLEIIDPCEFPHIIRSQEPTYELKYSYKLLKEFLKKEFQIKLTQ